MKNAKYVYPDGTTVEIKDNKVVGFTELSTVYPDAASFAQHSAELAAHNVASYPKHGMMFQERSGSQTLKAHLGAKIFWIERL